MLPLEILTLVAIFGAVSLFAWFGFQLFGRGWQSCEEKNVEGGAQSRRLKRRRDKLFGIQRIDALVGMGNALRAGFSLPMAIELLAREMPNPVGQEMRM